MTLKISVITPVYGCTDCLRQLYQKVREAFENAGVEWELVLIDDRGPDDPWPVISQIASEDKRVCGVRLSRNHGQHLAIWAGLTRATGDWVAVIDCDLQDDPSVILELYHAAVDRDVEMILVDRGDWSDSWYRRVASRMFMKIVKILGGLNIDNTGNFGIYSRKTVETLLRFEEQEVFLPMMVALIGFRSDVYRLNRSKRITGRSSYSFIKLIAMAISIIIRFSDRPLRLSIVVGFSLSFISAIISVALVVFWAFGQFTVPGWTSTVLSVWFLSGLILATLGMHGFYLGKVFAEIKRRPRIIIEETTD